MLFARPKGKAIGGIVERSRCVAPDSESGFAGFSPFGPNRAHSRPIAFHPVGSGRKRSEMKKILVLAAVLYSAAAIAQTGEPPKGGDKPLVQVKPKASKSKQAPKEAAPDAQPADAAKEAPKGAAKSAKAAP